MNSLYQKKIFDNYIRRDGKFYIKLDFFLRVADATEDDILAAMTYDPDWTKDVGVISTIDGTRYVAGDIAVILVKRFSSSAKKDRISSSVIENHLLMDPYVIQGRHGLYVIVKITGAAQLIYVSAEENVIDVLRKAGAKEINMFIDVNGEKAMIIVELINHEFGTVIDGNCFGEFCAQLWRLVRDAVQKPRVEAPVVAKNLARKAEPDEVNGRADTPTPPETSKAELIESQDPYEARVAKLESLIEGLAAQLASAAKKSD